MPQPMALFELGEECARVDQSSEMKLWLQLMRTRH